LERAYGRSFGSALRVRAIDPMAPPEAIAQLLDEILESAPELLVFADHHSHAPLVLRRLASHARWRLVASGIAVHAYGDFSLCAREWIGAESALISKRIRFIGASLASCEQLRTLVDPDTVGVLPFPVDQEIFQLNDAACSRFRARLGISPDAFLVAYTGRYSLQKNTDALIRALGVCAKNPIHLALAGSVDDIGADFFGIAPVRGAYGRRLAQTLETETAHGNLVIHWMGDLPPNLLSELYGASDVFASLSTHHDEDFGMSPAEALCCGTPVLLSAWGGFHTFQKLMKSCGQGDEVQLVPLINAGDEIVIDLQNFREGLESFRARARTRDKTARASCALAAAQTISIEAVSKEVIRARHLPTRSFIGFRPLFRELAQIPDSEPRFGKNRFKDPRYLKLYRGYWAL